MVAKDECICWELDRESFNYIVKDAAVARRNKYDEFLQSVTLLASLEAYERSQIADALKPEKFQKGDCIVKQDDPGDKFYIVEEGTLYALKDIEGSSKRVMDYKVGDYFGELALLKNLPRADSVIVESENAKVLSMSRLSFNKMLGPLAELLVLEGAVIQVRLRRHLVQSASNSPTARRACSCCSDSSPHPKLSCHHMPQVCSPVYA